MQRQVQPVTGRVGECTEEKNELARIKETAGPVMDRRHAIVAKRVPNREFPTCQLIVDPLEQRIIQIGGVAKADDLLP